MKIVIIGAGIAGCTMYLELKKHIPAISSIFIYEAYNIDKNTTPEQRQHGSTHSSTLLVGGALSVAPNGLGVLQRLDEGLVRDLTRAGYVTSHSNLKDKNGNTLMRIEPNRPYQAIMPVPLLHGLVGVGGFVPAADVKDFVEKGSMNFVFGGSGFFGYFFSDSCSSDPHRDSPFHVSGPGESLAWWSTYQASECPDVKSLNMADVTSQLRQRYPHSNDPVVRKLLESVSIRNMYPTWTSPVLPTWEREGVVLLGDAAHALPPTSGQGSSQAFEDCEAFALFLAHELGKLGGQHDSKEPAAIKQAINQAAKEYIALRQPRVTGILEAAQKMQSSKRDMGLIREYAMYSFMRLVGFFRLGEKPTRQVIEYNIHEEVDRVINLKQNEKPSYG